MRNAGTDDEGTRLISRPSEWADVAPELDNEEVKLASYDQTLLNLLGQIEGQRILDYGCGPGVLASVLDRRKAEVRAYDISPDMRQRTAEKIGPDHVYAKRNDIPQNSFDSVICNLVLCIVEEETVLNIARDVKDAVHNGGNIYAGLCNPLIFQIPESQLDFRYPTGKGYGDNHRYQKTKKEGGYQIMEEHRPIEWYEQSFQESGLVVVKKHFTPEYLLKERKIRDFVIFEMKRE